MPLMAAHPRPPSDTAGRCQKRNRARSCTQLQNRFRPSSRIIQADANRASPSYRPGYGADRVDCRDERSRVGFLLLGMNLVSRCANQEIVEYCFASDWHYELLTARQLAHVCLPAHAERPCSAVFSQYVAGLHRSHGPNRICTNPDGEICHRSSLIPIRSEHAYLGARV